MYKINTILKFLFFLANIVSSYGNIFRYDYEYDENAKGWLKFHPIPVTWSDAHLTCFREGGVLASPENKILTAAMVKVLGKVKTPIPDGIYTGLHALTPGHYASIEGTPLSRISVQWAPKEPDNHLNGEACLVMLPDGTMADKKCSNIHPFICYAKPTKDPVDTKCGTVDSEYYLDSRTNSCYKFHPEPQIWSHAFAACQDEGAHLAIINSDVESEVLKDLFAKYPYDGMPGEQKSMTSFIGFRDFSDHGLWMTVHGQTIKEAGFDKWDPRQPDNFSGKDYCGGMFRNGLLDDIDCDLFCPFFCEKIPNSLIPERKL